ncbi:hypothetical protein HELRODRAFT_108140 [Helobdella robusta]|uniref:F-box domain-containing protein n=1 Tax=Helobdella robusta TaxID=6412 RepID=T1EEF8_HELRO|nr:hypothetical protein HELRODRAFT_108140 [Helobdella robusta]ESN92726.1 hypothetical protein HELRODRAFT_108140 [Helobdella robusta]
MTSLSFKASSSSIKSSSITSSSSLTSSSPSILSSPSTLPTTTTTSSSKASTSSSSSLETTTSSSSVTTSSSSSSSSAVSKFNAYLTFVKRYHALKYEDDEEDENEDDDDKDDDDGDVRIHSSKVSPPNTTFHRGSSDDDGDDDDGDDDGHLMKSKFRLSHSNRKRLRENIGGNDDCSDAKRIKNQVVEDDDEDGPPASSSTFPKIILGPFRPRYAIRPPLCLPPPKSFLTCDDLTKHKLKMDLWLRVFSYLSHVELTRCCMPVCKTWYKWCFYAPLWREIDLSRRKIRQCHLVAIARHQPEYLDLSYTNISRQQLSWLSGRLFNLRGLKLAACAWSAVSCLSSNSSFCPQLRELDLSWVSGCSDSLFKILLSASVDERPGVDATLLRLRDCVKLVLTGSDVTDVSVELIGQTLLKLEELNLSYCQGVTDKTIQFLTNCTAYTSTLSSSCSSTSSPSSSTSSTASASKQNISSVKNQILPPPNRQPCSRRDYKLLQPHTLILNSVLYRGTITAPSVTLLHVQPQTTAAYNKQLALSGSSSSFSLANLKLLVLLGCHSISVTSVNSAKVLRPTLNIVLRKM